MDDIAEYLHYDLFKKDSKKVKLVVDDKPAITEMLLTSMLII